MTAKETITEMFRVGVPTEKLGDEAADAFISLLDTITDQQAHDLLDRAAYETAQTLLLLSAQNLLAELNGQVN